jgi:general secretion pathway protein J
LRRRAEKRFSERGLMLIEILAAMGILALVTALLYGSITRSVEARELADRIETRYATARVAVNRMAREISMAFLTMHVSNDKRTQTLFKAENEKPSDTLLFSSMAHVRLLKNSHESDLSYIEYYGEESRDSHGKFNIMRREKPWLDDKPEEGGDAEILAEDVTGLDLKYWDDQQKDWLDEWDTTGVEKAMRLPRLVKITLAMQDENGKEIQFVTKTRIYMDKPLGF